MKPYNISDKKKSLILNCKHVFIFISVIKVVKKNTALYNLNLPNLIFFLFNLYWFWIDIYDKISTSYNVIRLLNKTFEIQIKIRGFKTFVRNILFYFLFFYL